MTNPSKVVNLFREKLESLYGASLGFRTDRADTLFSSINLPTMPPELRDRMEANITLEEVTHAIKLLKTCKRSGPDGFRRAYIRSFRN